MSFARQLADISRHGVITVNTVADLRAHPFATSSELVFETLGALAIGDGGGGLWGYDAASTAKDNVGTVVTPTGAVAGRRIRIVNDDAYLVDWFGCAADGITDDRVPFQACFAAAVENGYTKVTATGSKRYCLVNCGLYSNLLYDFNNAELVIGADSPTAEPRRDFILGWGSPAGNLVLAGYEYTAPGLSAGDPVDFRRYTGGFSGTMNVCPDADVYYPGTITINCRVAPTCKPGDVGVMFGGFNNTPGSNDQMPSEFIRVEAVDTGAKTITFDRPLTKTYFRYGLDFGFIPFMDNGWASSITVRNVRFPKSAVARTNGHRKVFINMAVNCSYENLIAEDGDENYDFFMKGNNLRYSKLTVSYPPADSILLSFDQGNSNIVVENCFLNCGDNSRVHFGESSNRRVVNNTFMYGVSNTSGVALTAVQSTGDMFSNNEVYNSGIAIAFRNSSYTNAANVGQVPLSAQCIVANNRFIGTFNGPAVDVSSGDFETNGPIVAGNLFSGKIVSTTTRSLIKGGLVSRFVLANNVFDVEVDSRTKNFVSGGLLGVGPYTGVTRNPISPGCVIKGNTGISDLVRTFINGNDFVKIYGEGETPRMPTGSAQTRAPDVFGDNNFSVALVLPKNAATAGDETKVWYSIPVPHSNSETGYSVLLEYVLLPDNSPAANIRITETLTYIDDSETDLQANSDNDYLVPQTNKVVSVIRPDILRIKPFYGVTERFVALRLSRRSLNAADTYTGDVKLLGIKCFFIPAS